MKSHNLNSPCALPSFQSHAHEATRASDARARVSGVFRCIQVYDARIHVYIRPARSVNARRWRHSWINSTRLIPNELTGMRWRIFLRVIKLCNIDKHAGKYILRACIFHNHYRQFSLIIQLSSHLWTFIEQFICFSPPIRPEFSFTVASFISLSGSRNGMHARYLNTCESHSFTRVVSLLGLNDLQAKEIARHCGR